MKRDTKPTRPLDYETKSNFPSDRTLLRWVWGYIALAATVSVASPLAIANRLQTGLDTLDAAIFVLPFLLDFGLLLIAFLAANELLDRPRSWTPLLMLLSVAGLLTFQYFFYLHGRRSYG